MVVSSAAPRAAGEPPVEAHDRPVEDVRHHGQGRAMRDHVAGGDDALDWRRSPPAPPRSGGSRRACPRGRRGRCRRGRAACPGHGARRAAPGSTAPPARRRPVGREVQALGAGRHGRPRREVSASCPDARKPGEARAGGQHVHLAREPARHAHAASPDSDARGSRRGCGAASITMALEPRLDGRRFPAAGRPSPARRRRNPPLPTLTGTPLRQAEEAAPAACSGPAAADRPAGSSAAARHRDPKGAERVVPATLVERVDAIARRGRRIGRQRSGQGMAEIVLGRQDAAHLRPPLMPVEAEHRREIAPVDRHAGPPVQPLAASLVEHVRPPRDRRGVAPRDGADPADPRARDRRASGAARPARPP